jgi:hypothetical protein
MVLSACSADTRNMADRAIWFPSREHFHASFVKSRAILVGFPSPRRARFDPFSPLRRILVRRGLSGPSGVRLHHHRVPTRHAKNHTRSKIGQCPNERMRQKDGEVTEIAIARLPWARTGGQMGRPKPSFALNRMHCGCPRDGNSSRALR